MKRNTKSIYNMIKKHVFTCSVFFIFISCNKKDKECYEKFQDLYLKRYTLWFGSENHLEIKPEIPNESIEYDLLIRLKNKLDVDYGTQKIIIKYRKSYTIK